MTASTHSFHTQLVAALLMLFSPAIYSENKNTKLMIANFSAETLEDWEVKKFKEQTLYQLLKQDGVTVLQAKSNDSASGLFKKKRIDLRKTPMMNWRWRIENRLGNLNEQAKSGDDFAARVYVVVSGGLAFWQTRAINYVWANATPQGKVWDNPFAGDHAIMVAIRSATDKTGTWYTEKRNVWDDLKKFVDKDIEYIDAVAIMTDTDNAKGAATAYYGDIYFTEN